MQTLQTFSENEYELLRTWIVKALEDKTLGSDEYEETLNSLSEKILWRDELWTQQEKITTFKGRKARLEGNQRLKGLDA